MKTDTSVKLKIGAIETQDLQVLRKKLLHIEGKFSQFYFNHVFQLFQRIFRPESRKTFKVYDGVNNLFNLGLRDVKVESAY